MLKYQKNYESSYVEEFYPNRSISKTIKRLSLCHELEIREYYATHKNYKETTRVFGLHDSTVREICKAATKTNKGRFGALKRSKETKKEQENVYLI